MKRAPFMLMFMLLCLFLFSAPNASPAATERPSAGPGPSSEPEKPAGPTVFQWEGRLGFIELKANGELHTPFGVFTKAIGGRYPKWYGRDGFIILKNHRLHTPYGLYRPCYR